MESFPLSLVEFREFIAPLAVGEVLFPRGANLGKAAIVGFLDGLLANARDAGNLVEGEDGCGKRVVVSHVPPPIPLASRG